MKKISLDVVSNAVHRHSPISGDLHRIKSVNAGISDLKLREGVYDDR
jgi:hypothetical protein